MLTVAPLAGAWIEMPTAPRMRTDLPVAPLAGAWIEISMYIDGYSFLESRTPRGCVD